MKARFRTAYCGLCLLAQVACSLAPDISLQHCRLNHSSISMSRFESLLDSDYPHLPESSSSRSRVDIAWKQDSMVGPTWTLLLESRARIASMSDEVSSRDWSVLLAATYQCRPTSRHV
jgi:hypothetical protein